MEKSPNDVALNHYLIHILENGPDFEQARAAADSLAKIATDSGHLTHMPGHIHYLAGEYHLSCQSFLKCNAIETAYLTKELIPAIDHQNFLHNLHYLIQAASDYGNYDLATKIASKLATVVVPEERIKAAGSQIHLYSAPLAAATPFIRSRQFAKAATILTDDWNKEPSRAIHFIRTLRFSCLLKEALLQDGPLSDESLKNVKGLLDQQLKETTLLLAAKPAFFAENQPLNLAKKTAEILKNESLALIDQAQLTKEKDFQFAWAYSAILLDDTYTEPPLMVTPVSETLAWCALSKAHPEEALDFFKQALERRPKSGHIYQGLAKASKELGNEADFQKYTSLAKKALFKPDPVPAPKSGQ